MRRLFLSAAIMAMAATPVLGDAVRIGTLADNPPYSVANATGAIEGFERALGDELCARAELECEWVVNDPGAMIPDLVSGRYDAIMAAVPITPENDDVIDFTMPYLPPAPSVNVGPKGTEMVMEVGSTAVLAGSVQEAFIATTGKTLHPFATLDEAVAAVTQGDVDVVLAYRSDLEPVVAASGGMLEFVSDDRRIGGGIGIGFREDDIDLRFQFEDAIFAMMQDGSLNALIVEWFGEDAEIWE